MVLITVLGILLIDYLLLTIYLKFLLKKKSTKMMTVLWDSIRIFKSALRMGEGWDGDNRYERFIYWMIGLPLVILFLLGLISILGR